MLTEPEQRAADALRALGLSGKRISSALDVPYSRVLKDREERLVGFDPEQAAAEGAVPGYDLTVVIADTQYPWVHEPSEQAVMDYVSRNPVDQMVSIGDFMDFYSLATFRKKLPATERMYLMEEVELGRRKFQEWADLAPNARRVIIEGNHEERLKRYAEDEGGEFFGLDVLTFESLMHLGESGWELVGPYGAGMWLGMEGGLWATHGNYVRKHSGASPQAHLDAFGHSVIHGHSHRLGASFRTLATGTYGGWEVGCLCDPVTTPKGTSMVNWQHGSAAVWTSRTSPRFHVDLFAITDGSFVSGGTQYGE